MIQDASFIGRQPRKKCTSRSFAFHQSFHYNCRDASIGEPSYKAARVLHIRTPNMQAHLHIYVCAIVCSMLTFAKCKSVIGIVCSVLTLTSLKLNSSLQSHDHACGQGCDLYA